MRKKLFWVIFTTLLILSFFFQFYHAKAATVIIDSYSETNCNVGEILKAIHPSASGTSAVYQAFSPTIDTNITAVKIYLKIGYGTPTANLTAQVYASTGTLGSTAKPTGSALVNSTDAINCTTLTASYVLYQFNFTKIALSSGTTYIACVIGNDTGGTIDGSNYVFVGVDTSAPTHVGNEGIYLAMWTAISTTDMIFYVYGDGPAPIWSSLSATTTALSGTMQSIWQDEIGLDYWCMETNNTEDGSLTNTTFTAFSSNPETVSSTITFNHFSGTTEYRFYANNTVGAWNVTDFAYISNPTWTNETTAYNTLEYYYKTDTHTIGTVTAYKIADDLSYSNMSTLETLAGNSTLVYGSRVWLVNREGDTTELTGGEPTGWIYRDSNSEGYNRVPVSIAESTFPSMCRALQVSIYVKFNLTGSWVNTGSFITDMLDYKGTTAGTWEFQLYTKRDYNGSYTNAYTYWGNLDCRSGFTSTTFIEPLPQERTIGYAWNGDWWNFITYPYTMIIGNMFYGLILFGVGVITYAQNRKTSTLVINLILFGGAGLFGFFIIDPAWKIIYAIGIIATAVIIYRVFR